MRLDRDSGNAQVNTSIYIHLYMGCHVQNDTCGVSLHEPVRGRLIGRPRMPLIYIYGGSGNTSPGPFSQVIYGLLVKLQIVQ